MVARRIENSSEIRAYIKGRTLLGVGAKLIYKELCDMHGYSVMSYSQVARWNKRFRDGRELLEDDQRSGRPKSVVTKGNIQKIQDLLQEDSRLTTRQLAKRTGINLERVHFILKKKLGLNKICARWIPHLLDSTQKRNRVLKAKKILKSFPKYTEHKFCNFITGDETWVHYFEPKLKQANRVWATRNAKRPVIAKRTLSVKKVLYVIFFTNKGKALQIPVPKGKSVTAKFYKNVVLKKLEKYFLKRRPATGLKYIHLLHDNASSHTAEIVKTFLKEKQVSVIDHPAYSPDLAPCDFFLFPKLKSHLSGRKYRSRKGLGGAISKVLDSIPVSEYRRCFESWIKRLNKCVKCKGDYFEGLM